MEVNARPIESEEAIPFLLGGVALDDRLVRRLIIEVIAEVAEERDAAQVMTILPEVSSDLLPLLSSDSACVADVVGQTINTTVCRARRDPMLVHERDALEVSERRVSLSGQSALGSCTGERDDAAVLVEGHTSTRYMVKELLPNRVHLGDPHAANEAASVSRVNTCAHSTCDGRGVAARLDCGDARGPIDLDQISDPDVLGDSDPRACLKHLGVKHDLRSLTHAGDRDAEERLTFDDLPAHAEEVADISVRRLEGPDERRGLTSLVERLSGLELGAVDLGEVAGLPAAHE